MPCRDDPQHPDRLVAVVLDQGDLSWTDSQVRVYGHKVVGHKRSSTTMQRGMPGRQTADTGCKPCSERQNCNRAMSIRLSSGFRADDDYCTYRHLVETTSPCGYNPINTGAVRPCCKDEEYMAASYCRQLTECRQTDRPATAGLSVRHMFEFDTTAR